MVCPVRGIDTYKFIISWRIREGEQNSEYFEEWLVKTNPDALHRGYVIRTIYLSNRIGHKNLTSN